MAERPEPVPGGVVRLVTILGYKISGASTIGAAGTLGAHIEQDANQEITVTFQHTVTLTAGTNAFELQASATARTARVIAPSLTVIPTI